MEVLTWFLRSLVWFLGFWSGFVGFSVLISGDSLFTRFFCFIVSVCSGVILVYKYPSSSWKFSLKKNGFQCFLRNLQCFVDQPSLTILPHRSPSSLAWVNRPAREIK